MADMHPAITEINKAQFKPNTPAVRSGDTVRVHQLIREGNKQRTQIFEGVVIRTHRLGSMSAVLTVRRIASGVGVEKTFMIHSPNVSKIEILRRSKVRRNFLSYLRDRRGKSARLQEVGFDKAAANTGVANEQPAEDEVLDEEITELDTNDGQDAMDEVVESTDEAAAKEEVAAGADESDADAGAEDDEQRLASEETTEGVEKADK